VKKANRIYVAGHTGLVGSAIIRKLEKEGYTNIITCVHEQLDLRRQTNTESFFERERPEYVFLGAAKVGGILANNTYKADFIYDNISISTNVIASSFKFGVKKLLNMGSSCIYPKFALQPLTEDQLLTGILEPTNEPYAIAKISAIKLCRYFNEQYGTNFISVMPTNLYGPNDNFDPETSHVLPALISKFHKAKEIKDKNVTLWGTGEVYREFLYVDDLANACFFLMKNYDYPEIGEFINVGFGEDLKIKEIAEMVKKIVGFEGEIIWDKSKPDGTPRKLLEISKIKKLGWSPEVSLEEGIKRTYLYFLRRDC